MKLYAAATAALCAITWSAAASAENGAKLCDKPRQMEGFKTCADVAKATPLGAIVKCLEVKLAPPFLLTLTYCLPPFS